MMDSLIHMTPLAWHGKESAIASVQETLKQITIDLEILVGKRR
jgi:23S rRNA (guanine745-N1)-methyltransferase